MLSGSCWSVKPLAEGKKCAGDSSSFAKQRVVIVTRMIAAHAAPIAHRPGLRSRRNRAAVVVIAIRRGTVTAALSSGNGEGLGRSAAPPTRCQEVEGADCSCDRDLPHDTVRRVVSSLSPQVDHDADRAEGRNLRDDVVVL